VFRATPERVYWAFLDADAMVRWLPPNGFTGKVHHMDAKVGGTFKMSFTNFTTDKSHSFGGQYLELVPHARGDRMRENQAVPECAVFVGVSLDGFIARPNGDLDWLMGEGGEDSAEYGYNEFIADIDVIVMGRKTFEKVLTFDK
jgi:hypothetical protein